MPGNETVFLWLYFEENVVKTRHNATIWNATERPKVRAKWSEALQFDLHSPATRPARFIIYFIGNTVVILRIIV